MGEKYDGVRCCWNHINKSLYPRDFSLVCVFVFVFVFGLVLFFYLLSFTSSTFTKFDEDKVFQKRTRDLRTTLCFLSAPKGFVSGC